MVESSLPQTTIGIDPTTGQSYTITDPRKPTLIKADSSSVIVPQSSLMQSSNIGIDPETGQSFLITDPRNPTLITPEKPSDIGAQQINLPAQTTNIGIDPETGQSYIITDPRKPVLITPDEKSIIAPKGSESGEVKNIGIDPITGRSYIIGSDPTKIELITTEGVKPIDVPVFGTPEYTEWYYNDPSGPGYKGDSLNKVIVDRDTLDVKVLDTATGLSTVTGSVKGSYIELPDNGRILKSAFEALDPKTQNIMTEKGYEEGLKHWKSMRKELPDGNYMLWNSQKDENGNIVEVGLNDLDFKYRQIAIEKGYQAMKDAMDADFKASHHVLPDGRGIPNEIWETINPYYQKMADEKGYDAMITAMTKAYELSQKAFEINQQAYDSSMAKLADAGAVTEDGNIMVVDYLRKYPEDTATIMNVLGGQNPEEAQRIIDEALAYIESKPLNEADFKKMYFERNGWSMEQPALNDPNRDKLLAEFEARNQEAIQVYKDKYGEGAFYGSIVAEPLSFVFSPARALAPDVTLKDISGMEWAVGAAQLASLGVGGVAGGLFGKAAASALRTGVGSLATIGTGVGTTGIFAADVYVNRNVMNNFQKGLSIAGLALPFIPELRGIAKGVGARVRPGMLTGESMAITADVGRPIVPKGMSDLAARQLVEDVEILNIGGKIPANELRALKGVKNVETVSITRAPNGVTDVKLFSADGNVVGHVSGTQRVFADTIYHASPNSEALINQVKQKGFFEVEDLGASAKHGFFTSEQAAQSFAYDVNLGSPSPGILAIRVMPDEIKPPPLKVRDSATLKEMKSKMQKMAADGKLEPGVYALYKGYINKAGQRVLEYELYSPPGTKFYPASSTWYAKGDIPQTGTTSLLDYEGIGKRVKVGDTLPVYWLTTQPARMAGKGVPSVGELYTAKILGDLTTIRKYAPWNLRLRKVKTDGEAVLSSNSPIRSAIEQIKLTPTPTDWGAGRMTGLIRNTDGDILLVRQLGQNRYDLPGGGVTKKFLKSDSPETSIKRELYEEIGIDPDYIQHTDTFKGRFNPTDKKTREFHIFEGVTKEKPVPGAEIAEYVWWDGKSNLKYPVADFAKDALKRSVTKQNLTDQITTTTILQEAMERAKNKFMVLVKDERGSIKFEDMRKDARFKQLLDEEFAKTTENVRKEAMALMKAADDDGYLPFKAKYRGTKTWALPMGDEVDAENIQVANKIYADEVLYPATSKKGSVGEYPETRLEDDSQIVSTVASDSVRLGSEPQSGAVIKDVTEGKISPEPDKPYVPGVTTPPEQTPPGGNYPPKEDLPPGGGYPPFNPPYPPTPPFGDDSRPPVDVDSKPPETEFADIAIPSGSLSWRQGFSWKLLPPPYRSEQLLSLTKPPVGQRLFAEGEGSARKTLQIIGNPPKGMLPIVDLGWAKVKIVVRNGIPEIEYLPGPEANIGSNVEKYRVQREQEAIRKTRMIYPEAQIVPLIYNRKKKKKNKRITISEQFISGIRRIE